MYLITIAPNRDALVAKAFKNSESDFLNVWGGGNWCNKTIPVTGIRTTFRTARIIHNGNKSIGLIDTRGMQYRDEEGNLIGFLKDFEDVLIIIGEGSTQDAAYDDCWANNLATYDEYVVRTYIQDNEGNDTDELADRARPMGFA